MKSPSDCVAQEDNEYQTESFFLLLVYVKKRPQRSISQIIMFS